MGKGAVSVLACFMPDPSANSRPTADNQRRFDRRPNQ
jgi:hypothetical protein